MSARGNLIVNGWGVLVRTGLDIDPTRTYLEIWDNPIIVPQRIGVLFLEKDRSSLSCPKVRVGVIEVVGVSVTPNELRNHSSLEY